jgi:outer membrane immunogenic protein
MFNPNDRATFGSGKHMKHFFFRLAFLVAAFFPVSSVLAADLDVPPPIEDSRPANFDWSGPYVGAFIAGITETGTYDVVCAPICGAGLREMNGFGWNGGALVGWNYQMDSFVMGIEGDWALGEHVAQNHEPAELTDLEFNNIATLRARLGWALDDTLIYATGGVAFVDSKFFSPDFPAGSGFFAEDSAWLTGWVIGGGMEHAFSDRISGRLEYSYMSLPDAEYQLVNGVNTADVTQSFDGIHTIRAGLAYNFGW